MTELVVQDMGSMGWKPGVTSASLGEHLRQ